MPQPDEFMHLYKIKDWGRLYENNRTRELRRLQWVPIPSDLDGDGYTLLMEKEDGAALYGAWVACVIVASRCDPRGTLLRRGLSPHNSASLSRITRIPIAVVERMLDVALNECKWLTCEEMHDGAGMSQKGATFPQEGALNGREGNSTSLPVELPVNFPQSEQQAVDCAMSAGAPEDFIRTCWNLAVGRSGTDSKGRPITSWAHYVKACYTFETNRKAESKHGTNNQRSKPGVDRNAGTCNEGLAAEYDLKKIQAASALRQQKQPGA